MIKRLSKAEFEAIYSKVPRLCVEVVIRNANGVVLVKRDIPPRKGWWHFPGGTVLLGERLTDAVERVARDELGVEVEIKKQIGYLEYLDGSGAGFPVGIAFLVEPKGEVKAGVGNAEVGYFKVVPIKTLSVLKKFLKEKFEII